ncbi:TPA: capsular biosynthesis protein, partial [Escherichia coli]
MFVITMAGLSSRFFNAGYTVPKYQLPLHGQTVFYHSINSFHNYFHSDDFIFIIRNIFETSVFIKSECKKLGIKNFEIITLDKETRGQAESAYIGLKDINYTDGIYIFNIDTIRHDYTKPDFINNCDGYLEVFEGEGKHWSFILPDQNGNVSRTTEKIRISNLCSDGLYYFKDKYIFESAFNNAVKKNNEIAGEYYVAPLYNTLIQDGKVIKY